MDNLLRYLEALKGAQERGAEYQFIQYLMDCVADSAELVRKHVDFAATAVLVADGFYPNTYPYDLNITLDLEHLDRTEAARRAL